MRNQLVIKKRKNKYGKSGQQVNELIAQKSLKLLVEKNFRILRL